MPQQYRPIAHIRSPYKQKFAIPRQANLVHEAEGMVIFESHCNDPNVLRELEQFSHVWLIFSFHASADQGWSATVQPPRLGGKKRVGVFASRSPFRPNPIGMSVVRNLGHQVNNGRLQLRVAGIDLLDGTPVLDIKPYLPYADALDGAVAGFAEQAPGSDVAVEFSPAATRELEALNPGYPELKQFIRAVLRQDPRPAWRIRETDSRQYGMTLFDLNIKWRVQTESILVTGISKQ